MIIMINVSLSYEHPAQICNEVLFSRSLCCLATIRSSRRHSEVSLGSLMVCVAVLQVEEMTLTEVKQGWATSRLFARQLHFSI